LTEKSQRAQHEIDHGKLLVDGGAEDIWGWGTPAGKIRARRRAEWISNRAGLKSGIRALEIGCGTGMFTEHFSRSGADILAVDISEDLLVHARQRNLPKTVSFVCSPFENLRSDEPFDTIIGSSVLHHLEIEPALKNIFRLLKPGGIMAFAEPNMLNPQIMAQSNIPWLRKRVGNSPDETAFFRWRMQRWLANLGFTEIHITPRDWLHPATPPAWIQGVQRLETALEGFPLIREFAGSIYITAHRPE
jgi:2-polyprenyl-3-methyl-5-hydroxy-6-metoxy-1,4-benzoquinol methylase